MSEDPLSLVEVALMAREAAAGGAMRVGAGQARCHGPSQMMISVVPALRPHDHL